MTSAPRPRRIPYLLIGVLLVLGCATGGVLITLQLGDRETVLALARPVSVGQELTSRDLREVSLAKDSGLDMLPARSRGSVEGRPVAYSLPEGALLTKGVLGKAKTPPAGRAVVAVGLKPGQMPSGLQSGNGVRVVTAPSERSGKSSAPPDGDSWTATVVGVEGGQDGQLIVVTLMLAEADARQLAAAPEGGLRIVMVRGGDPR
ncbi:hypothetical protein ACIBKX_07690 [Streptomyces sp. NPDC050658]|uniref:hypothetical protein n=1 Tax=unclassified Streptomyces TaxID=2593676 RepID=UPI00342C49ED